MSEEQGYEGGTPEAVPASESGGKLSSAPPGPSYEYVKRPVGDFDPRYKSPRSAALLSAIFPGLGQVYTGFYKRGAMLGALLVFLFFLVNEAGDEIGPPLAFAIIFLWMFSIIDSGRMAALYNYAVSGGEEIEMPQDVRMPHLGGSIVAGGILVVFSAIALSNTLYNVPLDWLEDWWPVFPLALGGYLLVRGVMDHMSMSGSATGRLDENGEPVPVELD